MPCIAPNRRNRLILGHILGYVDSYGAVHSRFTGMDIKHHSDYYPCVGHHGLWRWSNRQSIHWYVPDQGPDVEGMEAIRSHLTRKYGIRWWDNGWHDIDHLEGRSSKALDKRVRV